MPNAGLRCQCAVRFQETKGDDTGDDILTFELTTYPLTLLAIGVIAALIAIRRLPEPVTPAQVIEALLAWFVFFAVGVYNLYNFVEYAFFGTSSVPFNGSAESASRFEIAAATLGFAVVGFIAAFRSLEMRLLAVLGSSFLMVGAAYDHIHELSTAKNAHPGDTGLLFYADILVPVIGFVLLWMQLRLGQPWTQERRKSPYVR